MTTWRNVSTWPEYEVSDDGQVRRSGHLLAQRPNDYGYMRVDLWRRPRRASKLVHVLVCEAFHGPRPDGLEARHLNGDQLDNRADNLAWGTRSRNMLDAVKHGTHKESRKTHCPDKHPYDEANTGRTGNRRYCRACKRGKARRRRQRA